MPHPLGLDLPLLRLSATICDNGIRLLAVATTLTITGLVITPPYAAMASITAAAVLASLAAFGHAVMLRHAARNRHATRDVVGLAAFDPAPCLVTSGDGEVRYLNDAAKKRFPPATGSTLVRALGDLFANPAGVLHRLQDKAVALGGAREDVITRRGHLRLTVVSLDTSGFLWRFEEVTETHTPTRGTEGLSLPMMIAGRSGTVLFMNEAMRTLLGQRATHLDRVMNDLPVRPGGLHQVVTAEGMRQFRVAEVEGPGGRLELYFLPADIDPGSPLDAGGMAAAEDLPVGLLQLRADGTIVAANRLARELLRPEETVALVGQTLADRLEGLGRPVRDWLDEASKGRGLGRPEVLRVRAPDAEAFLQVTLGRVTAPGEVRLVAVLNDATELKTLEAQFVQSQKMQAIGQLAGGVAHDFNNLLTAISGHCDLMLLRHDQGDPDYGDLVQIHQNANRAASLVGQLLAFSRKQTLQPQVIDLRDTLSDLTHLLNRLVGERIVLTLHHEPGLPPIRADRRQLEQVIMNLVVNARDAMPEGGEIRIETMERVLGDELKRDRVKVPPGRYILVKVEDHGTGIAPDKLQKIFEPFYTTKRTGEGTGLGLSTAYGIVKQSGGFIFVDSVPGNGTVFTLYFPAHDLEADTSASPADGAPGDAVALVASAEAPAGVWRSGSFVRRGPTGQAMRGRAARSVALRAEADPDFDPVATPPTWHLADERPVADEIAAAGPGDGTNAQPVDAADLADGLAREDQVQTAATVQPQTVMPAASPDREVAPATAAGPGLNGVSFSSTRIADPAAGAGPAPATAKLPGEGVILLVEDEAPVRAFASRALRMRGYTVIEAENAEEALATLEDASLEVDVFVTDVIMPGLDGPTWVRKALESRPGVKVVFVSGYAEDSFGEEQARIPNSVFLPKPFSLSELTATVQDQMGLPAAAGPPTRPLAPGHRCGAPCGVRA